MNKVLFDLNNKKQRVEEERKFTTEEKRKLLLDTVTKEIFPTMAFVELTNNSTLTIAGGTVLRPVFTEYQKNKFEKIYLEYITGEGKNTWTNTDYYNPYADYIQNERDHVINVLFGLNEAQKVHDGRTVLNMEKFEMKLSLFTLRFLREQKPRIEKFSKQILKALLVADYILNDVHKTEKDKEFIKEFHDNYTNGKNTH